MFPLALMEGPHDLLDVGSDIASQPSPQLWSWPGAGAVLVPVRVVRRMNQRRLDERQRLVFGEEDACRAHHVADERLSAGAIEPVEVPLRDLEDVSQVAERVVVDPCGDGLLHELWVREREVAHEWSIARHVERRGLPNDATRS